MSDVLRNNVGHVVQNVGHVRMSDDFSYTLQLCGIIVESIIELTVYALDGLIYGLCASKYGFLCM